ncbi:MAG: TRAP transporter small permease [Pseudomonadota bacterium]
MDSRLHAKSVEIIHLFAALLLAAAVILMAAQVVLRFGFNNPQAWAEEVDRYFFVWSVYLGTIIALIRDTHIRVTVLTDPLGPPGRRFSDALNRWLNVLCLAFVGYWGYANAYEYRAQVFYTVPWMPQILFYLSVPVCMTLMVAYLLVPARR